MRESYDFIKSVKNPYVKRFKKQIPYQSFINLYLKDYVNEHRELEMKWG